MYEPLGKVQHQQLLDEAHRERLAWLARRNYSARRLQGNPWVANGLAPLRGLATLLFGVTSKQGAGISLPGDCSWVSARPGEGIPHG